MKHQKELLPDAAFGIPEGQPCVGAGEALAVKLPRALIYSTPSESGGFLHSTGTQAFALVFKDHTPDLRN